MFARADRSGGGRRLRNAAIGHGRGFCGSRAHSLAAMEGSMAGNGVVGSGLAYFDDGDDVVGRL